MGPYLKAVVGSIVAGLGVLASGLDDDTISSQEYIYAVIAFFTALAVVWATPNQP